MEKMFNKCFVLCLLMQFWFMIAFNMTLPLIAQYVVDMGESATVAGFAAGIFSFLALAFRPILGFLTDMRNNKMLLLVGYAASIIAFIGYGIAPNVGVIIVFRIFGQSIAQASLQGQVMKDAGPEQRGVASSTFFMGIDIGQGLGAIVGGALIDLAGYRRADPHE